ncbi:HlyD family secretion protein [Parendozoicomonas haliclonae]|uniref:p-hydroxybenzoic acid efflux pump subunit AaeA n=1 Tax=Parendozoicomonas haliclonae TaxID=1960125 RepID=A0A1X7AR56_9GAMM|nr:HlyD family secretion protein [Parendozoicomonas haliclonae]SMA50622.1 p-hydroxybenzoic acid efflux pump subunit AaeA [Parendozoicomonas haliclonae]
MADSPSSPTPPSSKLAAWLPKVSSLALVILVVLCIWYLWQTYLVAPWTRDGRLRAEIAEIAAQVSGNIVQIHIADNGFVPAGGVILEIDPSDYRLALSKQQSTLAEERIKQEQLQLEAKRLDNMPVNLVSVEARSNANLYWKAQQAAVQTAEAALSMAELNLKRTHVIAPFDGYVTNMDLRVGSWLEAGHPILAFINSARYFVVGYFQETRLQGVCPGAKATITFLGEDESYTGEVTSVGRGIADTNQNTSSQLLADVQQTFPWVRLAQRIPVRVDFREHPPQQKLIAGRTAAIVVQPVDNCP